jgi:uncharacterized protein (TIGR02001 family)
MSAFGATHALAQESVDVSLGVDLVSRYVWRGLNVGDSPSIQPSISFSKRGFEFGTWAAYSTANQITEGDEMDFWVGYTAEFGEGGSIGFLLTDYYFPNAGAKFSNFSNYDDEDGPGAHTLELGASVSVSESFPLSFSGYMNVYNDGGNNLYFQVDAPVSVGGTSLDLFAGFTPGSSDNPDYYGTEDFAFINLGLSVAKNIPVTDNFALPLFGSWIVNPNDDISYLVVGFSL